MRSGQSKFSGSRRFIPRGIFLFPSDVSPDRKSLHPREIYRKIKILRQKKLEARTPAQAQEQSRRLFRLYDQLDAILRK